MTSQLTPPDFVEEGRTVLTGVTEGSVAPYVLVAVRDPLGFDRDAAEVISDRFDNRRLVADTGMFVTYTGAYRGVPVTVCSTGSGAPDTEIAFAELAGAVSGGRPTFIRVGTSGSAAAGVDVGDLVITTAAVRSEGTTRAYVPPEYPAVASFEAVASLADAATAGGHRFHLGITRSTDSIYAGQGREILGFAPPGTAAMAGQWTDVGVLNYERETSLLLTLANVFGFRGGSVCSVVNSAVTGKLDSGAGVQAAIETALEAVVLMARRDRLAADAASAVWVPSLG
jgi:uridine phosphorylase